MPCRKCRSASAFMSSGVARKAGECSQVQVSGRDDRAGQEMTCRRGPPRLLELLPEVTLGLVQVGVLVAVERRRGRAVTLDAEPRGVLLRPGLDGLQEMRDEKLGERLAPIVTNVLVPVIVVASQGRQVGA